MKKNKSLFIKDEIAKDGKRANTKNFNVEENRQQNRKEQNRKKVEMEDATNELDKTNEPRKESDINLNAERYKIHARRNKFDGWSEWSHVNTVEQAFEHADKISSLGWQFKIFDKKTKEIIHKND